MDDGREQITPGEDAGRRGAGRRTLGQKLCIVAALTLLVAGMVALLLSCCWPWRRAPVMPPLPPAPPVIIEPAAVTVVLSHSRPEVTVDSPGRGAWMAAAGNDVRPVGKGFGPSLVRSRNGRLTLNGREVTGGEIEFHGEDDVFLLQGRAYRGYLKVRVGDDGNIEALNVVAPEDYLRSVLGSEMYSRWPMDALVAQAVAARTYMLYALASKDRLTLVDMAYKGVSAESRATDLAVEATRGVILVHDGRPLPAYFHSTCGGHTVPVEKVFAVPPLGPLAGGPCQWCRHSHHFQWHVEIGAAEIAERLGRHEIQDVRSIVLEGAGADGYAHFALINESLRLGAYAFRLAMGASVLKSTRFSVSRLGDSFRFDGQGYGHGVGLCQWGACGMARAGKDWLEILQFYYPGSTLQKVQRPPPHR